MDLETNRINNDAIGLEKNVRKRMRNPKAWKSNITKALCQAGEPYVSRSGKMVPKKNVKTLKNCMSQCRYKCQQNISPDERKCVHASFYSLSTQTEKRRFILNTTERSKTGRTRRKAPSTENEENQQNVSDSKLNEEKPSSKRNYSFKYFFVIKGKKLQVCKTFYLTTLDISQKPIYTSHSTKNALTNTATPDLRGKSGNSRKPDGQSDVAKNHTNPLPTVAPHYCGANTNPLYLGSNPNVSKTVSNDTIGLEKNVKKRMRNPKAWKSNITKALCQAGEQYVSRSGKMIPKKRVKTVKNCLSQCRYKCQQNISSDERKYIHDSFYSLLNQTDKRHFIINTTERCESGKTRRKTIQAENESNQQNITDSESNKEMPLTKRKFSFKYFFIVDGKRLQVCKTFYLSTLDISQKPVYTSHSTKNCITNEATPDRRGRSGNSRIPEGNPDAARRHIQSFPVIGYCKVSNRLYLGSNLNISKMYNLYKEFCNHTATQPVKKSLYYKIFATEFNLGFDLPKSDAERIFYNSNNSDQRQIYNYNDQSQIYNCNLTPSY